jgi:hypothetical protein
MVEIADALVWSLVAFVIGAIVGHYALPPRPKGYF